MMNFIPAIFKKSDKPRQKLKLIWLDYLFIAGFLFNVGALVSTYLIVGLINHTTGTSVGNSLEANPINEFFLHIPLLQLAEYIAIWGFVGFSYIAQRRQALNDSKKMLWFTFFVLALSFLLFTDLINDLSLVAKVLIA